MTQRCDNCRFYKQQSCKRFPPVVSERRAKGHAYPPVDYDDWCGEWQMTPSTPPKVKIDFGEHPTRLT